MSRPATKYLTKRKGSTNYYVRVPVPLEHQPMLGKKEIWRSLNTADLREAKQCAHRAVADIHDLWRLEAASPHKVTTVVEPTQTELEQAARRYYQLQVEADIDERFEDREFVQQVYRPGRYKPDIKRLQRRLGVGDHAAVDLEYWSEVFGFQFQGDSPQRMQFAQLLMRAEVEAHRRFDDHDRGKFGRGAKDAFFAGPLPSTSLDQRKDDPEHSVKPADAPSFEELLALHNEHVAPLLKRDTLVQRAKAVRRFAEFIAPQTSPVSATKSMAREWRNALRKWPLKADQTKVFAGLSFREVLLKNETLKNECIGARTRNKYLSEVSAFFKWLRDEGYVEHNVFENIQEKLPKTTGISRTFSDAQMQRLFASPLFTGCLDGSRDKIAKVGSLKIKDWRYWLPILAAFTGARQGELAQLELTDVGDDKGIPFIMITNEGEDALKSVKNPYSRRRMPLHSRVLELGFLDYLDRVAKTGHRQVFPELKRDARDAFGMVSKFYQKYFKLIDLNDDPTRKVVFHSFRHRFTDELRRNHSEFEFQPLLGHAGRSTTSNYGEKETLSLRIRQDMVETVTYDFVDWSALY